MSLNLSSPLQDWEFKQRGFITFQLLAHYFLGVGSLRLLFLPSEAAEGGRLIGPAGCSCCFYKESSISHCGDLALMAGHRQGQHPPIAWMTSIVGSRRDSMVFWGGFEPQVIFFRRSAAGGKNKRHLRRRMTVMKKIRCGRWLKCVINRMGRFLCLLLS